MATKKVLVKLIEFFNTLTSKRLNDEEAKNLLQVYYKSFQGYTDREIKQASEEYIENGEYFPPKPFQITSLIKDAKSRKHQQDLVNRYTCSLCHEKVSAISPDEGGKCLDCGGFPPSEKSQIHLKPAKDDFKMEGRIKCQSCGDIGMCIKKPRDTGIWECQKCYSGLTKQETAQRYRDLVNYMNRDKIRNYVIPEWIQKNLDKINEQVPF